MVSFIEIESVSYRYEETNHDALSDVSLGIERGECVALLGPNGSGKTTLIKHLNGLLKPQTGRVAINGVSTRERTIAQLARTVGYVFQNPDHMIFADSVEEEVSFGPRNLGMAKDDIRRRVDEVLAFTSLAPYRETHPMSLSGGEKQRLALAAIIVSNPEILILDEPTTGLDYKSVQSMVHLVTRLKNEGKTIILVTHDMSLVSRIATRAVVMLDGSVVADGTPLAIFSDKELVERAYLEQPPALALSALWGVAPSMTPESLARAFREGRR